MGTRQLRKCLHAVKVASKAAHVRTPYQSCMAGKLKGTMKGKSAAQRRDLFAKAAHDCKGK